MLDEMLDLGDRQFDTRWRGYDRDQVDAALAAADRDVDLARSDRDAALAAAEDATRQLVALRAEAVRTRLAHTGGLLRLARLIAVVVETAHREGASRSPKHEAPADVPAPRRSGTTAPRHALRADRVHPHQTDGAPVLNETSRS
ncbi:DivIVA domain-containing protein [Umezawaea sp.]|uniref:DivIVA domain-containing protein n=1 Tax=Umezawaea sp. TaxID=1955258 RepID=UPI002ED3DB20